MMTKDELERVWEEQVVLRHGLKWSKAVYNRAVELLAEHGEIVLANGNKLRLGEQEEPLSGVDLRWLIVDSEKPPRKGTDSKCTHRR